MQRLRTFVRSTGGIQWRLLRSGGGDVNAMARAIEVPNGLRGHHSEGTPPTSDEQVSCCNDKQRKPDHPGKGDESRKDDICHFLDRQLLYDEEEEPGNDANEDNSTLEKHPIWHHRKLDYILENNRMWVKEKGPLFFQHLAKEHKPQFLYIGCSDARLSVQNMLGLELGQLFVMRNIANMVVNTDMSLLSGLTYAVDFLKVKDIIICGHYDCGGIRAAMRNVSHGNVDMWIMGIRDVARLHRKELHRISDEEAFHRRLVELNVQEQTLKLYTHPVVQRSQAMNGYPQIHAFVYDVADGYIRELDVDFRKVLKRHRNVYSMYSFASDRIIMPPEKTVVQAATPFTSVVLMVRKVGKKLDRTLMCTYVDTKAECRSLRRSDTVKDLKSELQKVFPGHPPVSLQRLFMGTQLLSDDATLGEISREDKEGSSRGGRLRLLLDVPPPVDKDTFDPSTVVPSTSEGLLESYCSNLMAMQQMQMALSKASSGDPSPFVSQGNSEADMTCSVNMKSGYEQLLKHLRVMSKNVVVPDPNDPALDPTAVGPLHDLFRDWARVWDVDWNNTIRIATFLWVCCRFGAPGPLQRVVKNMIIPSAFLYQTHWARFFRKVAWNLIPVIPGLPEAVEALLPAPEQVLVILDENRYTRELYGAAGPDFSPEYIEKYTGDGRDSEICSNEEEGDEHEQCNLQCKEEDEESTEYSVESIGDGEDSQDYVEDDEDIDGEEDWEEDVIHNRRIVEEED